MPSAENVALVTGASSGIGAIYAERLADRGHDLVLVARRRDRLDALASRLREVRGRSVDIVVADLSDKDGVTLVEDVVRGQANLSIVVNNAGFVADGTAVDVDPRRVDEMIEVDVNALARLSLAAARRFSEGGKGTIINIGSVIAVTPRAGLAGYSGCKAFVLNFTRSLELELRPMGVRVQAVMPGPVRTEIMGDKPMPFPDELIMSPEDVVDAALSGLDQGETVTFPTLVSPEAWSKYELAREELFGALRSGNKPAERYGVT